MFKIGLARKDKYGAHLGQYDGFCSQLLIGCRQRLH